MLAALRIALDSWILSIRCRAMGFVASSCNSVLFAAFRGMLKVPTSLKIMIVTQVINAALDPFMIFGAPSIGLPAMGVAGAAFATSISEWICTFCFVYMLYREKIVDMASLFRIPSSSSAKNFILNGAALQMRFALLRLKDIYAMRAVVAIGTAGTAAAANALSQQMFTLGGSIMMALGLTATALVPKALHNKENGSPENAKALTSRLMKWSALMGVGVGVLQMCALPIVLSITSLPEVQAAAVGPCLLACAVQVVNGIMLCSEGVVRAHRQFRMLLVASAVGAVSFLGSMPFLKNSLEGIWICLGIATAAQMVFLIGTPYVNGRWVEKAKAA